MEKTIKIDKKSVRLSNNIGWTMEYRDQFNHDIVPSLMPMLAAILDILGGVVETVGTKDVGYEDLIKAVNSDKMLDAVIHMSGLEFVELINIIWAMAKTADESIPEPREWVRQFSTFPLDEIAPTVFKLIVEGVMSSKNLKRLESLLGALRPTVSVSTTSSSPALNEA